MTDRERTIIEILEEIQGQLDNMEHDIHALLEIADDISTIQSDVSTIEGDVSTLQTDVSDIDSSISDIDSSISNMKDDIGFIRMNI